MREQRAQRRRVESGRRIGLLLLALGLGASLTLGVARAGDTNVRLAPAAGGPLLGVNGNVARFKSQTGQASTVHHAFLHWEQGLSWGSPFAALLPALGPIPMLHLGTEGQNSPEAITPAGIADGQGDRYLLALNRAIAVWGKGIYVRPLGEMNNSKNAWSGVSAERTAEGRGSLARHLSGGVLAHLRDLPRRLDERRQCEAAPARAAAGTRASCSQSLPEAPDRLEPARGRRPSRRGQRGGALLPGARLRRRRRRVDLRRAPHRHGAMAGPRGAVPLCALAPEAVLGAGVGAHQVDDPAFVQHMCTFLKTHPATEVAAFYESSPSSRYDLGSKPKSPRGLPGVHHAPRRNAPALGGGERRREADRSEAGLEPWLRAGAARRPVLAHGAPQRSDRALAARLRRRHRRRRRRPAARDRRAHSTTWTAPTKRR